MTPLHFSANDGNITIVEFLINNGAEINAVDKSSNNSYICGLLLIVLLEMDIVLLLIIY